MPDLFKKLSDVSYWSDSLGLLPISLSFTSHNEFILLNGGAGDFCLQINSNLAQSSEYYNSAAWSSNTKNFVVLESTNAKIYNWKRNKIEPLQASVIENNLSNFYEYLVRTNYKSEIDIVPFIVNIYRQIRNLVNEKSKGIEALNLLFLLLASLEENNHSKIDFTKWGLEVPHIPAGFDKYIEQFKLGVSGLKPNLELILKHSSGALFQEAHKEAVFFNKQIGIFSNTLDSKYELNKLLYSSIHYTPSYIARSIVENCLNSLDLTQPSLKILDPACGSSEFLIEVLKQLKNKDYTGEIDIHGWDAAETAINTSRFLLTYEKRHWINKLTFDLKLVSDSLQEVWDTDYDLVLMNPPFVSWELMNKVNREAVMSILGSSVSRRPNQASAFLYKAIQSLKDGGIIGCVIPSSIFSFSVYSELRKILGGMIDFSLVGVLGNFVFEEALTDVGILTAKKTKSQTSPIIAWGKNEKGVAPEVLRELRRFEKSHLPFITTKKYSIYKSEQYPINEENWKPISYEENEIIKKVESMILQGALVRTQNLFHVKLGIRTGNNDVFKISAGYLATLPENEQTFFRPIIDNDAIERGKINIKNFVWYPYSETKILINTESYLESAVPNYYNQILLPNKDALSKRSRKNEENWWLLSEPLSWLRKKYPKLVSTEFGKSGSFAFDKEGNFLVERGNGWLPKKPFLHLDSNYFYLAIFSCPFFDTLLSIYSKQILSGWSLGKSSTKDIPIPSVFSGNIPNNYYLNIVEIGRQISQGNSFHLGLLDEMVTKNLYSIGIK